MILVRVPKIIESQRAIPVNQAELIILLEFCLIVTKRDISQTEKYKDKTIASLLKKLNISSLSGLLLNYAKALLIEKDTEKAKDLYAKFTSLEKSYPFSGDYESTKELFEIVENMA